jgi:transposase-like protein
MQECPRCKSQQFIKSGIVKERQRYKCKECAYYYSVSQKSDTSNQSQRRLALILYLEGLGFRSIGRILGFSHVAVYNWIKSFGEQIETIRQKEATIVEIDEMHRYVGHKKTITGSGLLLIDLAGAPSMLSRAQEELRQDRNSGMK